MRRLTCGSLFAGIGGFDLGFERAGIKTIWQVEIDEYCRRVLARHFPDAERFNDVRECGRHNLKPVDIICGGFPCQPFSHAGRRKGVDDNRYLWPEMLRIISALRPRIVVGENVPGLLSNGYGRAISDIYASLEAKNYETLPPIVIPACALGTRHRRDRIWIIAHSHDEAKPALRLDAITRTGMQKPSCAFNDTHRARRPHSDCISAPVKDCDQSKHRLSGAPSDDGNTAISGFPDWSGGEMGQPSPLTEFERPGGREIERDFRGMAYGVSSRVDRLKALGNAVVPQIAEWIGRRIVEAELQHTEIGEQG